MLAGIGSQLRDSYMTHQLVVLGDGGASKRSVWLDSIAKIEGTSNLRTLGDEFVITLKNGSSVNVMFTEFSNFGGGVCEGEAKRPEFTCNHMFVRNMDDGMEKIDLGKVKRVEFLGAARKDKAGNAMYEPWRYSPFTGERIP
jgi:hypothetical protein